MTTLVKSEAKQRINELCGESDKNAPNKTAKRRALLTLDFLSEKSLTPLINSCDRSLLFEFFIGEDAYSFSFYNDGDVLYGRRVEGEMSQIIEVHSKERLKEIISEIAGAFREYKDKPQMKGKEKETL